MNYYLQPQDLLNRHATNRELIVGLRSALDQSYSRVVKAASDEWQRRFGGKDASDGCVTVRISSSRNGQPRQLGRAPMQRLGSGAA